MGVALLSAQRSKDQNTQVGACIVDSDRKIVAVGYNGMPIGCNDDKMPWERDGADISETKYAYVCHAELNAILNRNSASLNGATLYVTLFPCNECAKAIIQSKISRIVYLDDKYADTPATKASKRMLDMAGVQYIKYTSSGKSVEIGL